MIPRETGSDTSRVQIHGGVHDGATGTIVASFNEGGERVVAIALDTGGQVELTFDDTNKRETAARAQTLRTIGS